MNLEDIVMTTVDSNESQEGYTIIISNNKQFKFNIINNKEI